MVGGEGDGGRRPEEPQEGCDAAHTCFLRALPFHPEGCSTLPPPPAHAHPHLRTFRPALSQGPAEALVGAALAEAAAVAAVLLGLGIRGLARVCAQLACLALGAQLCVELWEEVRRLLGSQVQLGGQEGQRLIRGGEQL